MAIIPDPLLNASKLPIIIGMAFILIHFSFASLPYALFMVPDPVISSIGSLLSFLSPFFFIFVFGWAGWRANKEFDLGIIESGSVTAFSYVVLSSFSILITVTFLLCLPFVLQSINTESATSGFLSSGDVKVSGFGLSAILAIYALSALVFGTMINFAIGCLAAYLAKKMR